MKPDKINKLIKRLAAVSLWLIIWQIASVMTGLELLLASPVTVLRTLAGMLVTRQFYGILYLSVMHIMSGMLAGCLIGICAGILSARFDFLKEWLGIAVQLMKSLPVAVISYTLASSICLLSVLSMPSFTPVVIIGITTIALIINVTF